MVQITQLRGGCFPGRYQLIGDKSPANYPAIGLLVEEFDIWQEGYAGATVSVYYAGTTSLVPIYSDPQLTQRITNPQILTTRQDSSGRRYGKFSTNVYSPFAYELDINNAQQTGVRNVPLYTLIGEDASKATTISTGGSIARTLADRFADVIQLKDFGEVGSSPTTNTTTINNALAAAQDAGGGIVQFPPGTIPFTSFNLPANVFIAGWGKGVTVLQSQIASSAIVVMGNNAGAMDMTLDGVSVVNSSVGITGRNRNNIRLENFTVKRFQTNCYWQGGADHKYVNTDMTGGQVNIRARGDLNAAGGNDGAAFTGLDWLGGEISESTDTGIELYVQDAAVKLNTLRKVRVTDNVGVNGGVLIYGANRTIFEECEWSGNIYDITVKDNPNPAIAEDTRRVSGLHFYGGSITGGTVRIDGLADDIELNNMLLDTCTFDLTTPTNSIVLHDSKEISTTISGEVTKFLRFESRSNGVARTTTADGAAKTIWRARLAPGDIILINAGVIAERTDGTDNGVWQIVQGAKGAAATLNYDNQTANFAVGNTIVGQTSGARAIIQADSDSGTTGTLSLVRVTGTFLDNETITESGGTGSAQANGVLVEGAATLIGTVDVLHDAGSNAGAPPANWDFTIAVNGQEVLVQVTGDTGMDIQWDAKINTVFRN